MEEEQEEEGGEEVPTFCQHQEEHFHLLAPGQQLHEVELEWDLMHSKTSPHVWICNKKWECNMLVGTTQHCLPGHLQMRGTSPKRSAVSTSEHHPNSFCLGGQRDESE